MELVSFAEEVSFSSFTQITFIRKTEIFIYFLFLELIACIIQLQFVCFFVKGYCAIIRADSSGMKALFSPSLEQKARAISILQETYHFGI